MKNQLITMKSFYNVDKINFKDLDKTKLLSIINRSKKINELYLDESFRDNKCERYLRIMELIHTNYRKDKAVNNHYATTSQIEKFLLFMFSVDPNFEIAIIHASEDRIFDIKKKIREKFGVYDPYLVRIENAVIKKLLSNKKRNEISEEIEKRVFN